MDEAANRRGEPAGDPAARSDRWGPNARLAWDTLALRPTRGIPTAWLNVMDQGLLEEVAGHPPGAYQKDPERVYRDFQLAGGACLCDQWIPRNPLTMGRHGFEADAPRGPTTGAPRTVVDDVVIDSPEAVVEHMERVLFPRLEQAAAEFDPADRTKVQEKVRKETAIQDFFGPNMLKAPYGGEWGAFPSLRYTQCGYEHYLMAYALYPEVMERCFRLHADLAALSNRRSAAAIRAGGLPPILRLDHDMADSRGTLVSIESLDRLWLPHFVRAIEPLVKAGIRLLWHCDGNLMQMVPRLIEAGVGGFQGFQYEDGMDYPRICRMTDRQGGPLMIWAGVSVTTTLPHGTREDVARKLEWLVKHGPRVGLFLGASSSIVPNTNRENVKALLEGLKYYQERGRE